MAGAGGPDKAVPPSPALTPGCRGFRGQGSGQSKGAPWNSNSGKLNGFATALSCKQCKTILSSQF